MWEDCKTGSKWVIVNRCYFPGDLPENVGRPSPPESNEVDLLLLLYFIFLNAFSMYIFNFLDIFVKQKKNGCWHLVD